MSAKKKNGIPKEVAKKVVQYTAYKAQEQGRRAGEDLRNTADGESTTEEYAHEKVEDSAKETAYAAGDFTFRATKLPYRAYRQALQKRQAKKAIIPECQRRNKKHLKRRPENDPNAGNTYAS